MFILLEDELENVSRVGGVSLRPGPTQVRLLGCNEGWDPCSRTIPEGNISRDPMGIVPVSMVGVHEGCCIHYSFPLSSTLWEQVKGKRPNTCSRLCSRSVSPIKN